jgi:hypothetical protein
MGGRQNASSEVLVEGIDSFRVRNAVLVLVLVLVLERR